MNKRMIIYILGWVLIVESVAMQVCTLTSLIYQEHEGLYFLLTGLASALLGILAVKVKKQKNMVLYQKAGFAATALSWILMSLIAALPFFLSGEIPNYLDAFFESVSGFTTTGATILRDVEGLSHCMLLWRSVMVGRHGRHRLFAGAYSAAGRTAKYLFDESRKPRSHYRQGGSQNAQLCRFALRCLFWADFAGVYSSAVRRYGLF